MQYVIHFTWSCRWLCLDTFAFQTIFLTLALSCQYNTMPDITSKFRFTRLYYIIAILIKIMGNFVLNKYQICFAYKLYKNGLKKPGLQHLYA